MHTRYNSITSWLDQSSPPTVPVGSLALLILQEAKECKQTEKEETAGPRMTSTATAATATITIITRWESSTPIIKLW